MTAPSDEFSTDENAATEPQDVEKRAESKPTRKGGGPAWFAVILALVALGLFAYQWWRDQSAPQVEWASNAVVSRLQTAQSDTESALRDLRSSFDAIPSGDGGAGAARVREELELMARRLNETQNDNRALRVVNESLQLAFDDLQQRLSATEAGLAGISWQQDSPADQMEIAEAGFLLRLASERLQLFGDVRGADTALRFADAQLEILDDPLLLTVRRSIAESRATLAAVPTPDAVELSSRLTVLQNAIARWPFPGERPVVDPGTDGGDESGWWERIKASLSGLVTVRRKTSDDDVLLTIEDKDFLRQGVWLQLETARLALMRQDGLTYGRALQRAGETMAARFDAQSAELRQAMGEIEALRAIEVAPEMPDISEPWSRLNTLAERRMPPAAEAAIPAGIPTEAAIPAETAAEGDARAAETGTPVTVVDRSVTAMEEPAIEQPVLEEQDPGSVESGAEDGESPEEEAGEADGGDAEGLPPAGDEGGAS